MHVYSDCCSKSGHRHNNNGGEGGGRGLAIIYMHHMSMSDSVLNGQ